MKAGSSPCAACENILHPKTGFTQNPCDLSIELYLSYHVILANQFASSNENTTGEISGTILDWHEKKHHGNIHPKIHNHQNLTKTNKTTKIPPTITVDFSNVSFLSFKGTTRKKPTASPLEKVGRNPRPKRVVKTPRLEGLLISLIHMGFVTLQPFLGPLGLKVAAAEETTIVSPHHFFVGMNIL